LQNISSTSKTNVKKEKNQMTITVSLAFSVTEKNKKPTHTGNVLFAEKCLQIAENCYHFIF
jgi:hypothetical protein